MNGRKLVIDAQIFQTPAWHRGMGKYSMEFITSLDKDEWDLVEVILSDKLPMDDEMLSELKSKNPKIKITLLNLLPNGRYYKQISNKNRAEVESHLSKSHGEESIDYLIISLMQREICPVFPLTSNVRKLLLIYDLIPLMFHENYLNSGITQADYLTKMHELLLADHYLTISKTVANDMALYVGIDSSRLSTIDGGPIRHSTATVRRDKTKPFILMTTSDNPIKNNMRGVKAFEKFNKKHDDKYSLVLTSFFGEEEKKLLHSQSSNLIFTGNISGEELNNLYANSVGVLIPSEYEGLGLPVLEAVESNKPIACSNISVFREMSSDAFNYFDPHDEDSIAAGIEAMIDNPKVNGEKYAAILANYSWDKTNEKFIKALSSNNSTYQSDKIIAIFGIDPEADDPVARNLLLTHAELNKKATIDYFYSKTNDPIKRRVNFLQFTTNAYEITPGLNFNSQNYDELYYVIGNGENFSGSLFVALANPGIVVLHDTNLKDTWEGLLKNSFIDESRLSLEQEIDASLDNKNTELITSLIANQKAVIVFSDQIKKDIESVIDKIGSKTKVYRVDLPINSVVYRDILPKKDITMTTITDEGLIPESIEVSIVTDRQTYEHIARLKSLLIKSDNQPLQALLAMLFGTIVCAPNNKYLNNFPSDAMLKYKNTDDVESLIERKLVNEEEAKDIVAQTVLFADSYHYKEYADNLLEIMGDLDE
jgi:glycosyltransferase involved in cell wall biosynthesis